LPLSHPASRRRLPAIALAALLALIVAVGAAGCGSKVVSVPGANGTASTETVPNIHFANTKFVLHMGLAFGAFHRYIYEPLRAGALSHGAPHRLATLAKGALAAAFIVHELRIAREDALSSNQLRPLLVRVENLEHRIASLIPGLKHGSTAGIGSAASATTAVGSQSSGLGLPIRDIAHAI
jgi:hypothetical protein